MAQISYAQKMGQWVTARCEKRIELMRKQNPKYEMPECVTQWLDHGGNSPPDGSTPAETNVLGWLLKTIVKPDWPERE
jgi:hypothetical protein